MTICIVAGEASGDKYGARLFESLKRRQPNVQAFGLGGAGMMRAGVDVMTDMTQFAFMGFIDPIRHYPKLKRLIGSLTERIKRERPAAVVLIDYPGFNLRVAQIVHAMGIPVVYFMVPQVWAWGGKRLALMRRVVTRAVVGLPFEEEFFKRGGVPTSWVGHPLVDIMADQLRMASGEKRMNEIASQSEIRNPKSTMNIVGFFPGSRVSEVKLMWPVMKEAFFLLKKAHPGVNGWVAQASSVPDRWYGEAPEGMTLMKDRSYDVMAGADYLVVSSGTTTLEAAFFKKPMVVMYKLPTLTYQIFDTISAVRQISLVNLIAKKLVVPELIQRHATPNAVAQAVDVLWSHPEKRAQMTRDLGWVVDQLGAPGVFDRVAGEVLACR